MYDANDYHCIGRLGQEPELRYTPAGKAVCTLNVAIQTGKDETLWMKADLWEKAAENATEWLHKGSRVYLTGRLKQRDWTDKDGNARRSIELTVNRFQNLTPKAEGQGSEQQQRPPQGQRPQQGQGQRPPQQGQRSPQGQGQRQPQGQGQRGQQLPQNNGWGADADDGWATDSFGEDLAPDEIPF